MSALATLAVAAGPAALSVRMILEAARAHGAYGWIEKCRDHHSNQSCCGKIDCLETAKELAGETLGGFYLHEYRELIPRRRCLVREDGKYWLCLNSPFQTPRRGVRCLLPPHSRSLMSDVPGNSTKLSAAVDSTPVKLLARCVTPALLAAPLSIITWIGNGVLNRVDKIETFMTGEAQKTAVFRVNIDTVLRQQERILDDHETRVRDLERRTARP